MRKNPELFNPQSLSINDKIELNSNGFLLNKQRLNIKRLNLNICESNQIDDFYDKLYLPVPKKRKKYIFGDFVSFVEKYNMLHRFILIKKGIQSTTKKFDIEIRKKYKTLMRNNVHNFNFNKYIRNIFFSVNFNFDYYKRNYQGKLNAYKIFQMIRKYILLIIIKRINLFINIKKQKAIKIQSITRSFILRKKFMIWKQDLINKTVLIQKYVRRLLIRKKYKVNLVSIINFVKYNQSKKIYEKNLNIMIKKRNAIRIIESWWERILEERKRKELENQIKKMPKDCQILYRQFISLGKQTKIVKKYYKDIVKNSFGVVP